MEQAGVKESGIGLKPPWSDRWPQGPHVPPESPRAPLRSESGEVQLSLPHLTSGADGPAEQGRSGDPLPGAQPCCPGCLFTAPEAAWAQSHACSISNTWSLTLSRFPGSILPV